MNWLGHSRSVLAQDHLLHTPDAFVRAPLPGLTGGLAIVHASPALGAGFTAYTAELDRAGTLDLAGAQRFAYVLEGSVSTGSHHLVAGSYLFAAENAGERVIAREPTRLFVIEKPYLRTEAVPEPRSFVNAEDQIHSTALNGDPDLQVRLLLPDTPDFDFAVNTMTYRPGASLSMVEVHIMEHGLLMLEGGGIYRLGDRWYPVEAGDFIWMRAYCPQWFGAIGKQPAKYIIYKDWNRHPLA